MMSKVRDEKAREIVLKNIQNSLLGNKIQKDNNMNKIKIKLYTETDKENQ